MFLKIKPLDQYSHLSPMAIPKVSDFYAFDEIIKENKDLVVFFSAVWCGPCKKARTALEQLVHK